MCQLIMLYKSNICNHYFVNFLTRTITFQFENVIVVPTVDATVGNPIFGEKEGAFCARKYCDQ